MSIFETVLCMQAIQISLLVGIVWLVTKTITKNQAHLSYVLWLVVLVKCVMPPFWASPVGMFSWIYAEKAPVAKHLEGIQSARVASSSAHAFRHSSVAIENNGYDSATAATSATIVYPTIVDSLTAADETRPHVATISVAKSSSHATTWWLLGGCFVVTGFSICAAIRRTFRCVREVLQDKVENPALSAQLDELRHVTGVKKKVRLVVTTSQVGPGVFGLFRPTIVLPQAVVADRSAKDMTPILAHELIHIRRGDLWIGLCRQLIQAFWWFHPMVWLLGRRLRHGAEECCDEEVIASLGIAPLEYAQSLLRVLETKQRLRALPLVPGVRPIDVTSQRLEKIMKINTHRPSTPRWCWVLAFLMAAVTLPGAGMIVGQQLNARDDSRAADTIKPSTEPPPATERSAVRPARSAQPSSTNNFAGQATAGFITGQTVDSNAAVVGELAFAQNPSSGREREIQKALKTRVTVQLKDAPLSKAIETITKNSGINVFLDQKSLQTAGDRMGSVRIDTPVTIQLRHAISLESALNLILEPLQLTYVVRNEVLNIEARHTHPSQWSEIDRQSLVDGHTSHQAMPLRSDQPEMERVPLSLLRRSPVKEYKISAGDVLGIFVEGIFGGDTPPVNFADSNSTPSVGFPTPVGEDGTLPLPLIDPVKVAGLSLTEAKDAVVHAYTIDNAILMKDEARVLVSLVQPRRIRVLVFREDSFTSPSEGNEISLAATDADVLSILARTGGLPSAIAGDEIMIYRANDRGNTLRIPIRMPVGGEPPKLTDKDVSLFDGDIVVVPRRSDEPAVQKAINRR